MPHPTDIHVGQKIREARTNRGMSQEQLASYLGVSFQQVQKYEKGANRIGSSRLWTVCEALETPINFFFDDLKKKEGGDVSAPTPSLKSIQVARDLEAIADDQVRQNIYKLIRAIREDG